MTVDEVLSEVVRICRGQDAKEVILFGSRAKGTARERSDIDIAVRGAEDFGMIEEQSEGIPTLYTIDIVNLDECRSQLLKEDIELYGRKIYEKI